MTTLGPDLLLDPLTGDLDMTGGDAKMQVSVAQAIAIRLRFFRGEWFIDESVGIPYFQDIFVKAPNLDHVTSIYRQAIVETPGVKDVLSLSIDYDGDTRKLSVTWSADTDEGELSGEEAIPL